MQPVNTPYDTLYSLTGAVDSALFSEAGDGGFRFPLQRLLPHVFCIIYGVQSKESTVFLAFLFLFFSPGPCNMQIQLNNSNLGFYYKYRSEATLRKIFSGSHLGGYLKILFAVFVGKTRCFFGGGGQTTKHDACATALMSSIMDTASIRLPIFSFPIPFPIKHFPVPFTKGCTQTGFSTVTCLGLADYFGPFFYNFEHFSNLSKNLPQKVRTHNS